MCAKKNTCCGFQLRSTVKWLTIFEITRNTTAIILNLSTFVLKSYCWLPSTDVNDFCHFLMNVFPNLEVRYTGLLGAFFLVFSCLQLYVAILCYHGVKEQSLEKCQSAFISLVTLWIIGLSISVFIVDKSPILIWAVIIIYSLRLAYLTIFKKYVNQLRNEPPPTPV